MQTVTVAATKAFQHKGEHYGRGDAVTVSPVDASVLARHGLVSLVRDDVGVTREVAAPPVAAVLPGAASVTSSSAETPTTTPAQPRRRRRYSRKDLRAERSE